MEKSRTSKRAKKKAANAKKSGKKTPARKKGSSSTGSAKASRKKKTRKKTSKVKRKRRRKKSTPKSSKRGKNKSGKGWTWRLLKWFATASAMVLVGLLGYGFYLDHQIKDVFAGHPWSRPARVYAAPVDLYVGRKISAKALTEHLQALGYQAVDVVRDPATFSVRGNHIRLITQDVQVGELVFSPVAIDLTIDRNAIVTLFDGAGRPLPLAQLSPLMIGSILPKSGEDRIVVGQTDVPGLLQDALIAVEDRRFASHHGVDPLGILRAAWINLRSGELSQGGSTISQQLIKSHFLSNEKTWRRKFKEALMAVALDARMDKDQIMLAYINEIYLGQQGNRAIHGFDLAARFYFGRTLIDLEVQHLASLVAMAKGPSYYDPRRHPARALKRRNLVLKMLVNEGLLSDEAARDAVAKPLGVLSVAEQKNYLFPAFLSVVKRSLLSEYDSSELSDDGLIVHTTLDVLAQKTVESAIERSIPVLEQSVAITTADLQTAVVVMTPDTGEVIAIAGGRTRGIDGLNRAVNIQRPIGSLMKPFIAAAALESNDWQLTSMLPNERVTIELENGDFWEPRNFSERYGGEVPLFRAISESINIPMVNLGLSIGVDRVADVVERLGYQGEGPWYPAALLGAVEMSPFEVAQLYTGLANRGFVSPQRAVRNVENADGQTLTSYPLRVTQQVSDLAAFKVVEAMKLAMLRGTGRSVQHLLPRDMQFAGKSGSTNDLRDSWFAGFSADLLVVVWVGMDDNRPTSLTGSRGALQIWRAVVGQLSRAGLYTEMPESLMLTPVDYLNGMPENDCYTGVLIPVSETTADERVRCEVW